MPSKPVAEEDEEVKGTLSFLLFDFRFDFALVGFIEFEFELSMSLSFLRRFLGRVES